MQIFAYLKLQGHASHHLALGSAGCCLHQCMHEGQYAALAVTALTPESLATALTTKLLPGIKAT